MFKFKSKMDKHQDRHEKYMDDHIAALEMFEKYNPICLTEGDIIKVSLCGKVEKRIVYSVWSNGSPGNFHWFVELMDFDMKKESIRYNDLGNWKRAKKMTFKSKTK